MKIEITKERRKTICMKILSADYILIKAPTNMSDDKIQEFISSKTNWLNRNINKVKESSLLKEQYDFEKYIYKNNAIVCETNTLSSKYDTLSKTKKDKLIKEKYLSMFCSLEERVYQFAKQFGFKVLSVKPLSSTCKWGIFSAKFEMRLNYKLVILDQKYIDYVIFHELCHGKYMNHSPKFWHEVSKYCPNYKTIKKELNQYAFVIR